MTDWNIGGVILPGDIEWVDEFTPARKQSESMALSGGVIIQRSTQIAGLPMTLQTPREVFVSRAQIEALTALIEDPDLDVFAVTHPDDRLFNCRFRYGSGLPLDWDNTWFRSPPESADAWHTLTLRLMIA